MLRFIESRVDSQLRVVLKAEIIFEHFGEVTEEIRTKEMIRLDIHLPTTELWGCRREVSILNKFRKGHKPSRVEFFRKCRSGKQQAILQELKILSVLPGEILGCVPRDPQPCLGSTEGLSKKYWCGTLLLPFHPLTIRPRGFLKAFPSCRSDLEQWSIDDRWFSELFLEFSPRSVGWNMIQLDDHIFQTGWFNHHLVDIDVY